MPEYPRVTVTSHRPSLDGRVVTGESGTAVIVADDPYTVYINGGDWYGAWPVSETDLADVLAEQKRKEEEAQEAIRQAKELKAARERAREEEWAKEGLTPRSYLLTPDGEILDPQGAKAFEWVKDYLKQEST